jgi:hypothetical protein
MRRWREAETMAPKKYQYATLPDDHSIRMLTLQAGVPGDPLCGKLEFFNINCGDQYETISYTWGELDRGSEMICDNGVIEITSSLESALSRLRLKERERRLWVDQVCINQDDKEERSQQVQFMNRIYENALHVLVWLGEDEQKMADLAFKLVLELDETFQNKEKREKFRIDHTNDLEARSKEPWTLFTHVTKLPWVSWGCEHSAEIYRNLLLTIYTLL